MFFGYPESQFSHGAEIVNSVLTELHTKGKIFLKLPAR